MRKGIIVNVTSADRARLRAVVANRNSPQKHVWRAKIILLTAEGLGTNGIMRSTGRAKSVVWRWQERFMQEGVDGLLRDKTRPPGRKPLDPAIIEQVVALTAEDPSDETTHWTAGLMAKTVVTLNFCSPSRARARVLFTKSRGLSRTAAVDPQRSFVKHPSIGQTLSRPVNASVHPVQCRSLTCSRRPPARRLAKRGLPRVSSGARK